MSSLLRALGFTFAVALATGLMADDNAPVVPAAPVQPTSLIGLTRDEVVVLRGKPSGERARADGSVVMVYPDGAKIELRDGRVISSAGMSGAEIVGADGTRYVPGADGNIQRPIVITDLTAAGVAEEAPASGDATAKGPSAKPATTPTPDDDLADDTPPGAKIELPPGTPGAALENYVEKMEDPEEVPPPSLAKTLLVLGIDIVFRFGIAVLVLRLAIHFVGVPFFWPDLLKVTVLYLAVHEVMYGLGGLGGWWEFIPIFRLDDVVSFVILACSLTWFKIAGSGLTALKIAAMTKVVVVGLMLAVGLAVTFGLSAMQ